ncbi:hypothetical protein BH11MYX3_BH11MYX3_19360 [soil metagenome]
MNPAMDHAAPTLPSIFEHFPRVATQPRHAISQRKIAFWAALAVVPAGLGIALGLGSKGRGLLAGGVAALALGALRWQMARWFTEEPDYEREGRIGDLELRRYPVRIEARTEVDCHDLEDVVDTGFGRLACYIYGANQGKQDLEMSGPVVTSMRDGRYAMTFVMPPGRDLPSLPRPDDSRIELHEVPEKRVASLRFHGPCTRDNIARHERHLLRQLVDAGLSARGSVMMAGYDSPMTLPQLRRNELWIEIV